MSLDASEFLRLVRQLQLVSEPALRETIDALGVRAANVDDLAAEFQKRGLLTEFQARTILRGAGGSLVVGQYVVEAPLGAGGMGRVYRARHRMMDRAVALKVLHRKSLSNPRGIERFLQEVKVAARLDHPNIVTAFDAGEAHGRPYLVMEYVDGRDLASVVNESGPLSVAAALKAVLQAAEALHSAHGQGIVHRDVKPSNLLIDRDGRVKLLDLGLARWSRSDNRWSGTESEPSSEGFILGTTHFLSPEQAADRGELDHRTDIYSLGCTLYFLLTGKRVFPASSPIDVLFAHRYQAPPQLSLALPGLDPGIDELFQRMLQKNPEDRPGSMADVAASLRTLLGRAESDLEEDLTPSEPEHATVTIAPSVTFAPLSDTSATGYRRRPRQRPELWMGGALLLLLLAVGVGWLQSLARDPPAAVADSEPPAADVPPRNGELPQPAANDPPAPVIPAGLEFDGRESEAVIVDWTLPRESPCTIEVITTPRRDQPFGTLVSYYEGIDGWMLGLAGDRWCLTVSQGGIPHARLLSTMPVRWNEPQLVAVVFDGDRIALYDGGELQAEWESEPLYLWSQNTLRIGRARGTNTGDEQWYSGLLHQLRISSIDRGAVSATEFPLTIDPHTLGLYDCRTQQEFQLIDESRFARHGEIYGAGWFGGTEPSVP